VKFIYLYPELDGPDGDLLDAGPLAEVAEMAERAGWYGLALTEHPAPSARWLRSGGHQTLDPFVALGHVAAATRSLRLITYLAVAAYRNPLVLAKAAATVDKLSGGRFILGLGAGYQKSEFHATGAPFKQRGALLDEALEILPLHWSGEPFTFAGRHFEAREVMARPRPVSQPIPIWIGGNAEAGLRRVAHRANGWMPLAASADPEQRDPDARLAYLAPKIQMVREMAGSRAETLDFVVSCEDMDPADAARDSSRRHDEFEQLGAIGVSHVVVGTRSTDVDSTGRFLSEFAQEYCTETSSRP
jgi:probable F420-dependent oxidoreductase